MKKTYIAPRAEATEMELQQMICESVTNLNSTLIDNIEVDAAEALSNEDKGFDLWAEE